jgi:hypothetical protein
MKARLPRFLRLRSFWLGLPAFLFLLWAWRDSMTHVAALHREHGNPTEILWPPPEVAGDLWLPEPVLQPVEFPLMRWRLWP